MTANEANLTRQVEALAKAVAELTAVNADLVMRVESLERDATEREAAAFKRGVEMVRGIFAQGGMRVVGSTDDLIRAFGGAAR